MRQESQGSSEKCGFQNKTQPLSADSREDNQRRYTFVEVNDHDATGNGEVGEISQGFQSKSSVSVDSELYDYLKSKIAHNFAPNIAEKMTTEDGRNGFQNKSQFLKGETQKSGLEIKMVEDSASFAFQNKTPNKGEDKILNESQQNKTPTSEDMQKRKSGREASLVFQSKTPLLKAECGQEIKMAEDNASCDFQNKKSQENKTSIREGTGKVDSGSELSLVFQNNSPVSEEDQKKMTEAKSRLASRVSDLNSQLEKAESSLDKERRLELKVTAANAKLRQNTRTLAGDVASSARTFSERVLELMELELGPGEAELRGRVAQAEETADGIRKAIKDAQSLLREEDWSVFTAELGNVESEMERRGEAKLRDDDDGDMTFDLAKLCPELERLQAELREKLGQVQRSLRSAFNPSEVTFDPETLHPNLVLSEDMKSVKFSTKKQQYSPSPLRFSTFFQVLSAQSFSCGVHRWEVELEGAPWILGVCVASALPRSGLPSALETCPSSWALMWSSNLLTAFARSRATSLKKTSEASRRLRLELDLERRALTFHHRGLSGDSLIHRFSLDTEEPLHLGYRMLSGDSRGRVSITS